MSKPKSKDEKRRIKAELSLGEVDFIWRRGVLGWGIPTFLFYLVIMVVTTPLFTDLTFAQGIANLFPGTFFTGLVIFGLTGYFMGRFRWKQLLKQAGKDRNSRKHEKK